MIDRLAHAGHLDRRRDDRDRRRVHLHHSAAGRAIAEEFFGPLQHLSDDIMATLTTSELADVHRFLSGMTDAMNRHATIT